MNHRPDPYREQVRQVQASLSPPDPMWGELLASAEAEEVDQVTRSVSPESSRARTRQAAPPPLFEAQTPTPTAAQAKDLLKKKFEWVAGFKQKLKLGKIGKNAKRLLLEHVFYKGTCWTGTVLPLMIVLPPSSRMNLLIVLTFIAIALAAIGYMWDSRPLLRHGAIGTVSLALIYFFYQAFLASCFRGF